MKLGEMKRETANKYFLVVQEWNYPNESGREVCEDWDTIEEALKQCEELAEAEVGNYERNCGVDALKPSHYIMPVIGEGYVITAKNGLDEWFYASRVIEIAKIPSTVV